MAESPLTAWRFHALLALATALAFCRVPFGSFHFDDYLLLHDYAIASPAGWGAFWQITTTRPLTWFSFWLNYQATATHPLSWLLVSLLLHIACVLLLHSCLRRLIPPGPALLAAGLFALHPIQVEAVAWVFARSTLLCALFCLLTLRAWIAQRWWLAVAFFAVALLAKEESVFFPFLLLLLPGALPLSSARKPLLAMLALSGLAGARVLAATRMLSGTGAGFSSTVSPFRYALAQGSVIWRYLRMLFVPWGFNFDPDLHPAPFLSAAGWLALLVAVIACWKYRDKWLAGRWFLGCLAILLASSSVFPADDLAADRRLYLPLIALAPALALASTSLRIPKAVWIALACVLAALSFGRTAVWASELSLWTDAVRQSPAKLRPRIQLARALPPQAALRQLEIAAQIDPRSPLVPAEKGRIHLQANRPDLAIAEFGQAAALNPNDPLQWNNLGGAFELMGQSAAARRAFQHAISLDPCYADSRRNLGLTPCAR